MLYSRCNWLHLLIDFNWLHHMAFKSLKFNFFWQCHKGFWKFFFFYHEHSSNSSLSLTFEHPDQLNGLRVRRDWTTNDRWVKPVWHYLRSSLVLLAYTVICSDIPFQRGWQGLSGPDRMSLYAVGISIHLHLRGNISHV